MLQVRLTVRCAITSFNAYCIGDMGKLQIYRTHLHSPHPRAYRDLHCNTCCAGFVCDVCDAPTFLPATTAVATALLAEATGAARSSGTTEALATVTVLTTVAVLAAVPVTELAASTGTVLLVVVLLPLVAGVAELARLAQGVLGPLLGLVLCAPLVDLVGALGLADVSTTLIQTDMLLPA